MTLYCPPTFHPRMLMSAQCASPYPHFWGTLLPKSGRTWRLAQPGTAHWESLPMTPPLPLSQSPTSLAVLPFPFPAPPTSLILQIPALNWPTMAVPSEKMHPVQNPLR